MTLPPDCCGKRPTRYRHYYDLPLRNLAGKVVARSDEEGFRCKRCGKIRLAFPVDGSAYERDCAELLALVEGED